VDVLIVSSDARQMLGFTTPLFALWAYPFFIPVQFCHDAHYCFSYTNFDKPGKTFLNNVWVRPPVAVF
jgi:hypothetical protein